MCLNKAEIHILVMSKSLIGLHRQSFSRNSLERGPITALGTYFVLISNG